MDIFEGDGPPKEAQTVPMKKRTQHLIAEAPRKRGQVDLTIHDELKRGFASFKRLAIKLL